MEAIGQKRIILVGAGNVAWHLTPALAAAGHAVVGIYSRTAAQREELAHRLSHAAPLASLDLRALEADLVLIAVPDAALATVAGELQVSAGVVVAHTSGSQPLSVLSTIPGARTGVFYPLQTFSKSKPVDFRSTPLLLEAQDVQTLALLEQVARSLSTQVHHVTSANRKQLHLAAVFACNFTNHLLGISHELLQQAQLPTNLLHPLLQETISKATQQPPFTVQTGPAIRHDENVIQEHLQMLAAHPRYQELYLQLSRSIQAADPKGKAGAAENI